MSRLSLCARVVMSALVMALCGGAPVVAQDSAVLVVGEPFLLADADTFTIQGSNGAEARNRAAAPMDGTLENLYLAPNMIPASGSIIQACLRVNGVDSSVCVTYTNTDWPGAKGNTTDRVGVGAGDLISVHFTENASISSGSNVRASFDLAPSGVFADGFESGDTTRWGTTSMTTTSSVVVTGEPFMLASADGYSIGGSNGAIIRNRAGSPVGGTARNLFLIPNVQPASGSSILACLNVNGVDTSLCVTYTDADWAAGAKGDTSNSVALARGDLVSVHFTETGGVNSTANVRASFEIASPSDGAVLVTDEPFMSSNSDTFSVGGSSGAEERNRAAVPHAGTITNLYLAPNLQPAASATIVGCARVNSVDTGLCVTYTSADWPGAKGAAGSIAVAAGDLVTVHFTETSGVSSGSNVRASFTLEP